MTDTNIKNLPEGEYFTEHGYSQCYPWKVVRKTAKTIVICPVKTKKDPDWKPEILPGGFAGHCVNQGAQTWEFDGFNEEYTRSIRLNKRGKWMGKGIRYTPDVARYFYDYNF